MSRQVYMSIAIAVLVLLPSYSQSAENLSLTTKVQFGANLGFNQTHELFLIVSEGKYDGCFIIANATADIVSKRINLEPKSMSCMSESVAYDYSLKNTIFKGMDGKIGIKARHLTPKNKALKIINDSIELYQKLTSMYPNDKWIKKSLADLRIQKLGYLTIGSETEIKSVFLSDPVLDKKMSIK